MARLRALSEEYNLSITSKAYLLRPDTPEEGEERKRRPGEPEDDLSPHLKASAADAGLTNMKRPKRRPNSLKSLQAIQHAKAFDKGTELRDAFYIAYWEQQRDIGDWQVIQEIAGSLGLDVAEMETKVKANAYLDEVMAEFQQGMDVGFNAIPAFVIGDSGFMGAQPLETFRQLAERAENVLKENPDAFDEVRKALT